MLVITYCRYLVINQVLDNWELWSYDGARWNIRLLQLILRGTWTSVPNFIQTNVSLVVVMEENSEDHQNHCLGTMDVQKFVPIHLDFSKNNWKLWPAGGAWWKVRGSPKSRGFILWAPWISVMASHPSHWDLSAWNKMVDQLTDIAL